MVDKEGHLDIIVIREHVDYVDPGIYLLAAGEIRLVNPVERG